MTDFRNHPKDDYSCGLLAIGTEITTGQIVDRNSSWLAERLNDLHYRPTLHLSVPDERDAMLDALRYAATRCTFILVTGGLGPTQDDITREVLASFIGVELGFRDEAWQHIEDRMKELGLAVAPSNKRQCYFPTNARLLPNRRGTAYGFYLETPSHKIISLPGPPHEIEAIWEDALLAVLESWAPIGEEVDLLRYHTLGKSESAIGEIVEQCVKGTGLTTGYRPHIPFVEVKVWVPRARRSDVADALENLETSLGPWLVAKDDEDVCQKFIDILPDRPIKILDAGSGGLLAARLFSQNSDLVGVTVVTDPQAPPEPRDWDYYLGPIDQDGFWMLGDGKALRPEALPILPRSASLRRLKHYITEKSFFLWSQSADNRT